jgi:hypothetical protein
VPLIISHALALTPNKLKYSFNILMQFIDAASHFLLCRHSLSGFMRRQS